MLFGIGWVLDLTNVINITFEGWWTLFIIIPCLIGFVTTKHKSSSLIGLGIGVLLLLCMREVILWEDFWKYILCLIAIVWGITLIFSRKSPWNDSKHDKKTVEELKQIKEDGRYIRQINVNFGKQLFEFAGQPFEGADVRINFGFASIDLRNAELLDGAVITVDCHFGGLEIRPGRDVLVKQAIDSSFAGVETSCDAMSGEGCKTIYIKGKCSFGGIEIK